MSNSSILVESLPAVFLWVLLLMVPTNFLQAYRLQIRKAHIKFTCMMLTATCWHLPALQINRGVIILLYPYAHGDTFIFDGGGIKL